MYSGRGPAARSASEARSVDRGGACSYAAGEGGLGSRRETASPV